MDAAEDAVGHGDQRQKSDQHRGDVDGELEAIGGAARNRPEDIFVLFRLAPVQLDMLMLSLA